MKPDMAKIAARFRPYAKYLVLAALLVLIMAWASGAGTDRVRPGTMAYAPGEAVPEGALLHTVAAALMAERIDVVGTVESEKNIHISSRLSAYVKSVHVTAGQRVARDDVLVTLDDRELREDLAAAEAQLNQAKTEFERTRVLSERDAATVQALIAAESAYNAARANVDRIEVMLTYTELRSPIDGMVTDTRIEAGDLANPGQVVLTVYDPTAMRLVVPVPVRLIDRIPLDRAVELGFEAPIGTLTGRVTEIVGEIDPASRTRTVKVHIDTREENVLPGAFGRLWVEDGPRPAVLVPDGAVYRAGQLEFVQRVDGDRSLRRLVRTAPASGEQVEILSGLSEGDVILVNPAKGARP